MNITFFFLGSTGQNRKVLKAFCFEQEALNDGAMPIYTWANFYWAVAKCSGLQLLAQARGIIQSMSPVKALYGLPSFIPEMNMSQRSGLMIFFFNSLWNFSCITV